MAFQSRANGAHLDDRTDDGQWGPSTQIHLFLEYIVLGYKAHTANRGDRLNPIV